MIPAESIEWFIEDQARSLAVVWFGSSSTPSLSSYIYSTGDTQEDWERQATCWRERGRGGGGFGEETKYTTARKPGPLFNTLWILLNEPADRNRLTVKPDQWNHFPHDQTTEKYNNVANQSLPCSFLANQRRSWDQLTMNNYEPFSPLPHCLLCHIIVVQNFSFKVFETIEKCLVQIILQQSIVI